MGRYEASTEQQLPKHNELRRGGTDFLNDILFGKSFSAKLSFAHDAAKAAYFAQQDACQRAHVATVGEQHAAQEAQKAVSLVPYHMQEADIATIIADRLK